MKRLYASSPCRLGNDGVRQEKLGRIENVDVHEHIAEMLEQGAGREEEHGNEHTRKVLSLSSNTSNTTHPASGTSECA